MIAGLLALAAAFLGVIFTLLPLLREEPVSSAADVAADEHAELAARREDALRALREIDLDHDMGKITDEDHARLRGDLEGRAVRILAALDERSGNAEREA